MQAGIERPPQQKFRPLFMPIKFEFGNIPVAKFVSRTINIVEHR